MDYEIEEIRLPETFPFWTFTTRAQQLYMHMHGCLEMNRIVSGSGTYWIEEKQFQIMPGDLFIINNRERHMAVHDGSLEMQVFVFDPALVWEGQSRWAFLEPFFHRGSRFSNRIQGGWYIPYLDRMTREAAKQEEGWQMVIASCMMMLLAELYRHCKNTQAAVGTDVRRPYQRIRPVLDDLHEHYMEEITLERLANTAMLNKNYLCSCFKETMGLPITQYLEHLRIQRACLLLASTEQSVTEIAYQCGFNSLSYFNRIFRKIQKTTPSSFRKNLKIVQK